MSRLQDSWYRRSWITWFLLPVSWLFCLLVMLRRTLYRLGILQSQQLPVPVIVAGNISVGGTGKTPLVIALVELLRRQGWKPGVISRGYGGEATEWPQPVHADSDARLIGDEPLLIAQRTAAPMIVGPDRVAAARKLLATKDVDIIISDDGLQHYRMQRDVEIAVVDGARRLGNGQCLPAGPLREPRSRLNQVDFVVMNGGGSEGVAMLLVPQPPCSVSGEHRTKSLDEFRGQCLHALAGIGNPQRFFQMLEVAGLDIIRHSFPDHHHYVAADIDFGDNAPVLMTEKDAVKCRSISDGRHWYIPVTAQLPDAFEQQLKNLLER
jgi:tetraacyldisaccharide 4'-kinase